MTTYILLLISIVVFAFVLKLVFELAKVKKPVIAGAILLLGMTFTSGSVWYVLNSRAESKPPTPDSVAQASQAYIKESSVETPEKVAPSKEDVSYSEKNRQENRKAVETFKTLRAN